MVPSVQEQLDSCAMCGWTVDISFEQHPSGNPEYRTKKTECSNPMCKCRMYVLRKMAALNEGETEDVGTEPVLPPPHLRTSINNLRCPQCGDRTNRLYTGKSSLCCEQCLRGKK